MNYLKIENLTKTIKNIEILQNVNLEILKGEIFGLIGPNGAGKTTLMKILSGLSDITQGTVILDGNESKQNRVFTGGKVGILIENPASYGWLNGYENLKIVAQTQKNNKEQLDKIIQISGLEDDIYMKTAKYSLGMKQRLGIAMALLNNPELLILDEPLNGLDVEGVAQIRELIRKLSREEKLTILISSHVLSELDKICDRAAFIKKGEILAVVSHNDLKDGGYEEKYNQLVKGRK